MAKHAEGNPSWMTGACHLGTSLMPTSACLPEATQDRQVSHDAAGAAFGRDGLLYVCDYKVNFCVVQLDHPPGICSCWPHVS